MDVVDEWTGRHAKALLKAMRATNESFAETLGVAVRTVAKWNANPDMVLSTEMQQALDTALRRDATEDAKARFASAIGGPMQTQRNDRQLITPENELDALTSWIAGTNTSRDAVDQVARAVVSLARAHPRAPTKPLLREVLRVQQQTQAMIESGHHRFRETRELLKLNSDLLAHACMLLGDINEDYRAEQYGLAALMFAQEAESTEAFAWSARAKTARWQDRLIESADFAHQGYERSPEDSIKVQLAWYEANGAALLGDIERAKMAANKAEAAAETLLTTEPDITVWSFPVERQALFASSVATLTGDADAALRAAILADKGWESGAPRNPATWAQIRVGAALAHLMRGSLEKAAAEVRSMLSLEPGFRMSTVTRHLEKVERKLRHNRYEDVAIVTELREEIRLFNLAALDSEGDTAEEST
ncbi:hypothetical protein ACGFNU_23550 [Spirillospora sp. NPDC048911]|uniref:hypothetical protein n=1 Tax=Spirillospora sp. NPDC048911 TaxID=3364527 RepID=UPI003720F0EA